MAGDNRFANVPTGPIKSAVAVTPDDNADLATTTRALYVGGAGNLEVILANDTAAVIFTAVGAGYHPLSVKRVKSGSTTATGILALY